MIYTKRIISIFISICIIISSLSISIFAEDNIPVEVSSNSIYCLGEFEISGEYNQTLQQMVYTKQFLPILDQAGLPYNQAVNCNYINFDTIKLSFANSTTGYFSFYMIFDTFCTNAQQLNFTNITTQLMTIGLKANNSSTYFYPEVEVGILANPSSMPNYQYECTFYLKWDLRCTGASYFTLAPGNTYFAINHDTWIIVPRNFSIIKYTSDSYPDYSSAISDIASNVADLYDLSLYYIPGISQYLDTILGYIQGDLDYYLDLLVNYTYDDLDAFLNEYSNYLGSIESYLDSIEYYSIRVNNFLSNNFGVNNNTPDSIWWLLKGLFDNLASSSNTNSLWYRLITTYTFISNLMQYDRTDSSFTISAFGNSGYFDYMKNCLKSINDFHVWEYYQQKAITQSSEYQAGESIKDNISNSGGYGSLSGFSSNASGFGNIGLIGTIFNGLASAFRWFTNDTKNNIDAVQPNRDVNETISSYLDENLNLIQEYLTTEADPND